MFEYIHRQLTEWYAKRRQIDINPPQAQIIVSQAARKMQDLTMWAAREYRLLPCSDTKYEVFSLETNITYVVKLDFMTCTCFECQSTGIPCSHAIAVILACKEDPQAYAQVFLSLDAFHKSYAQILLPPNADNAEEFNNKTFTLSWQQL
jgi:SWIM zinc finger